MDTGELIHKVERVRMRASLSDSSLKNAGSRVRSGWKTDTSVWLAGGYAPLLGGGMRFRASASILSASLSRAFAIWRSSSCACGFKIWPAMRRASAARVRNSVAVLFGTFDAPTRG